MVSKQWHETWMVHGFIQAISIKTIEQDFCQYQTHDLLSMENLKFVCLPLIVVGRHKNFEYPRLRTSDVRYWWWKKSYSIVFIETPYVVFLT